MRKWTWMMAMCALAALPLCGQQKQESLHDESSRGAETAKTDSPLLSKPASDARATGHSGWAIRGSRRATPFASAAGKSRDEGPARIVPRGEIFGGYQYADVRPGDPFDSFSAHGGIGSFEYNVHKYLGLVAEFAGVKGTRRVGSNSLDTELFTYLFGPRLNIRKFNHVVPFAHFLIGGAHSGIELTGASDADNSFALATGGGLDVVPMRRLAIRLFQADYLMTSFSGPAVGGNSRQDNFRVATGLVYRFGGEKPAPPPPPNRPPTASCSASASSVYTGSGDVVTVSVQASDPDNDPLSYTWSATGGAVDGTGPQVRWNSAGLGDGTYTVTAKVDDGRGGTATCAADVKVEARPNRPPVISCSADRSPIVIGERTGITSNASDPDNDPLTYSYSPSGGQIVGTGSKVEFDSTGLSAGTYTVKCSVSDGRGGTADGSTSVEVKVPPQVTQLEARLALHSIYFPTDQPTARNPNGGLLASQQKTLTSLANDFKKYLVYKPDAHLILEGHADQRGSKEYNKALSERRVERARRFLTDQGIPPAGIEIRALGLEHNLTPDEVKKLVEENPDVSPADRQKILKNLRTIVLANNRRVDITLSTTGQQSVRQYPFNAEDALTLISPKGGGAPKGKGRPPAPKKKP